MFQVKIVSVRSRDRSKFKIIRNAVVVYAHANKICIWTYRPTVVIFRLWIRVIKDNEHWLLVLKNSVRSFFLVRGSKGKSIFYTKKKHLDHPELNSERAAVPTKQVYLERTWYKRIHENSPVTVVATVFPINITFCRKITGSKSLPSIAKLMCTIYFEQSQVQFKLCWGEYYLFQTYHLLQQYISNVNLFVYPSGISSNIKWILEKYFTEANHSSH